MGGFGYTDASYKSYPECTLDALGGPVDCSGNRLQNAPKYTASFSARFDQPVSDNLKFFAQGEISYRSSSFIRVENTPNFIHQNLTLVNMSVGIEDTDGTWRVSLWGKNIFDTAKEVLSFDFLGTDYAHLNAPRTYGIGLSIKY